MTSRYNEFASATTSLPRYMGAGNQQWKAQCPAHEDRNPSLSIGLGRDHQYILKCFAGCTVEDIVGRMGFDMEDLWPEVQPTTLSGFTNGHDRSGPPPKPVVLSQHRRVVAAMGAHDFAAHYADDVTQTYVHKRTDDGQGGKRIWWEPKGVEVNRLALFSTGPLHDPVVVVEGERAALHVAATGDYTAVASYGTSYVPSDEALEVLRGRDVLLWPDNDTVGRDHMTSLGKRISSVAKGMWMVPIPEDAEVGWDAGDVKVDDIYELLGTAIPWEHNDTPPPPTYIAPGILAPMDAVDLLGEVMDPLQEAISGLLPEGLGVIGSPPKVGKSLLAYQMGVEMVLGGEVLGVTPELREVRYYALEDGRRRSQARVRGLLLGRRMKRGLRLVWTAPRLGGPLEGEIGLWLDENPRGVVIIDVLSKVRPDGRKGLNAYDEDYAVLTALHDVARDHPGSVILLITHDRKAGAEDWMTRITGTRGVTGMADFVIFIARKRDETIGHIYVTGRDIEDQSWDVEFTINGWRKASTQLLIGSKSPVRQTIWNFIRINGPVQPKEIALGTGVEADIVRHRLADMLKDGDIRNGPAGYLAVDD